MLDRSSDRFTFEELSWFRTQLEIQKRKVLNIEEEAENEALIDLSGNTTDEISHVRLHPADLASDEAIQDVDLSLAETESRRLQDIEDALFRIQDDRFGFCEDCGNEISVVRLRVLPIARYCESCARGLEIEQKRRQGGHPLQETI